MSDYARLISKNLFEECLIAPAKEGYDTLIIISAYASVAMVQRQFDEYAERREINTSPSSVHVYIGMTGVDGVSRTHHEKLQDLARQDTGINFSCRYITAPHEVHSKLYLWLRGGEPREAWTGSANYTLAGFGLSKRNRSEVLTQTDPEVAYAYVEQITSHSVDCLDPLIGDIIDIIDLQPGTERRHANLDPADMGTYHSPHVAETVTLSFLASRTSETPSRSGINWGQRESRNPNEAYIHVPAELQRSNFFPPIGEYFVVRTDDGKSITLTRAQDNGKALETPESNALLGEYFRDRLGVRSGQRVTSSDFLEYGRTDVSFTKLAEGEYLMDFSVSPGPDHL